jgi:hypothetical protein
LVTAVAAQIAVDAAVSVGHEVTVLPPRFVGVALAGLVATVGTAHRARAVERVAMPAGAVFALGVALVSGLGSSIPSGTDLELAPLEAPVLAGLLALALAGAATLAWRRDARPWWAALILMIALPALVLMPSLPFGWAEFPVWIPGSDTAGAVPVISGVALVVLAVCVHLRRIDAPLAYCGVLSLVTAAGMSAYAWLVEIVATGRPEAMAGTPAYLLFVLAVAVGPGGPGWTRWVRPVLTASAVVAVLATIYALSGPLVVRPEREVLGVLTMLGLIALASPRPAPISRPAVVGVLRRLGAVVAVVVAALALALTSLGLPSPGVVEIGERVAVVHEAFVPPAIAMIGFVATTVATAVAVLSRDRRWAAPLAAFAVGTLGVVVFCYVASDSRVIAVIVASCVALLIGLRLVTRSRVVGRTTPA